MRVDIARGNASLVFHFHRERKALAARGGAGIQNAHPGLNTRRHCRELCRRILHIDLAGCKQLEPCKVPCSRYEIAAGKPRVLPEQDILLRKRPLDLIRV